MLCCWRHLVTFSNSSPAPRSIPGPRSTGGICPCVKARAAFCFMRGSGRAGRRRCQKQVWSWAEDRDARTFSEPGVLREQVQGTLVPKQGLRRRLGGRLGLPPRRCPGSAGYEAGIARQGRGGQRTLVQGNDPILGSLHGILSLNLHPYPLAP